jgi:hypothetical protein
MKSEKINRQNITLRLTENSDENFLELVYADSRREELAMFGWNREQ